MEVELEPRANKNSEKWYKTEEKNAERKKSFSYQVNNIN